MNKNILILFVFFKLFVSAQDTLYTRYSSEIVVAKVIEINITEIKYKVFDRLDGPSFVVDKNQISKIKFSNGSFEIFNVSVPKIIINNNSGSSNNLETIELIRKKKGYLYKEKKINLTNALVIVEYRNNTWKSQEISTLIYESKKQIRNQYILGLSGFGIGILTFVGIANSENSHNYQDQGRNTFGILALGALGFVATQVVAYNCKLSQIRFTNKAVDVYNKNILNP